MTILNDTTVVVVSAQELKTVLEGNNQYSYIYFGSNIQLTAGITIASNKTTITIDGTYKDIRYTYEDMNSSGSGDTISVRSATINQVTVQNIDVIGHNYYGIVYVPETTTLQNVVITYQNLTYQGPQITFHPTGLSRYIDCDITILTSFSPANEVAECNRIEIGGITKIDHTTTGDSMFWFRGSRTPYFHVLANATATLTSLHRELYYGPTNLDFSILQKASFTLSAYNGMGYATYSTSQVLIDKEAVVHITQTGKNGSYPTWYCNGPFVVNEGASLQMISDYANIATSNYNLYFVSTKASFTLNNPKEVVLYNKVADVIHADSVIPFTFQYSRLNRWTVATAFANAGSITDLPSYAWYKGNALSNVSGTISSNTTVIQSNDYTTEELAALPALTNFTFQKTPVLSIGKTLLNISPITDTSTVLEGYTTPLADIQITYLTNQYAVTANDQGLFTYDMGTALPIGTNITFVSNLKNSFIYQSKTVQIVYSGDLSLDTASKTIAFSLTPFSTTPVLCPRSTDLIIQVTDTRVISSNWKLYAKINHDLISNEGYRLTDSIVFIDSNKQIIPLSDVPILVYTGENNNGTTKITTVSWIAQEGILLRVANEPLENGQTYTAMITWSLEP